MKLAANKNKCIDNICPSYYVAFVHCKQIFGVHYKISLPDSE